MRLFFYYCRLHGKIISLFLIFCAVFAVTFSLYRLPLAAVAYATSICAFLGAVVLGLDFSAYYKKHRLLQTLLRELSVTIEHLPAPKAPFEEDYQAMLQALYTDKLRLTDEMNRRYTDLVDYYTVWAHQIKTPIAAMRLHLQGEDTPQNRELSEELQRIEQYVEMVLCYLRLDADTSDYVIRAYDLDSIVRQAVHKYASQFIRRKIRLNYQPLECQVLTDEKWLLFVIEQVLSNALKYTKTGVISITLEDPKILCISDTGIGIAPEDLPRIFEKGYTGYNGRGDKKASGIGLYLCRRICGNLGHQITASSSLDSGTVIRLHLKSAELETE